MSAPHGETPPAESSNASTKRVIRAELIVATLALVASACASVAAILQTRESVVQTQATMEQTKTIATQLGASVWPYLTIENDYGRSSFRLSVTNQGLGPALIRSFAIAVDGQPKAHLRDIISIVDKQRPGRTVSAFDFGGGSVIRPSQTYTIFSISDAKLRGPLAEAVMQRSRETICYCSLLAECWVLNSEEAEPASVHRCGKQALPMTY